MGALTVLVALVALLVALLLVTLPVALLGVLLLTADSPLKSLTSF
jgi:hypothetical protein